MGDNIEVRNEIARMTRWKAPGTPVPPTGSDLGDAMASTFTRGRWWRLRIDGDMDTSPDHPIPNTLDEAAKLPEGWEYEIHNRQVGGVVWAAAIPPGGYWANRSEATGANEKEARFNLCLEVLKRIESAALAAKEPS